MNKYYLVGSAAIALLAQQLIGPLFALLGLSLGNFMGIRLMTLIFAAISGVIGVGLGILWLMHLVDTISKNDVLLIAGLFAATRSFPYLFSNLSTFLQPGAWPVEERYLTGWTTGERKVER